MFMHYENMTQTMVNSKINPRNDVCNLITFHISDRCNFLYFLIGTDLNKVKFLNYRVDGVRCCNTSRAQRVSLLLGFLQCSVTLLDSILYLFQGSKQYEDRLYSYENY